MGAGPSKVAEKKEKVVAEDLGWDDAPSGVVEESEDEKEERSALSLSEADIKDAQVSTSSTWIATVSSPFMTL